MAKEYLQFQEFGLKEDEMWGVCSKRTGNIIGYIDRDEKWNRLVFDAKENTIWTSECLQQIVDFLKGLEK